MTERNDDTEATQDAPLLEQNDRTVEDVLDGIVVQTRADLTRSPQLDPRELLRDRLSDTGAAVDEDTFEVLVQRATSVDEPSDPQPGVGPGSTQ
ncbi:hypothetical protein [Agromyces sp. NPDC058110]|uniref:hypothetical protein n=1 Tax=Agromyces sp. NPDC058110 TaxID=3346345 RepID=UPI0036D841A9